jgi:multisubunit Na+/H+ antiporter MnhB subunit
VARDVIFLGSISLMALAFWKYPLRRIPVKQFMWAILAYCGLLAAWFFLPPFLGNFPHLPITTINNPNLGLGIFQETPWYNALLPNFFEMAGWILLSVCMAVSLYQWKRVKLV